MMEGTDDDPGRKSFEQQGAQRELVDVSIELHWLVGSKIGVSGKIRASGTTFLLVVQL
jgi:hypothetical protein